MSDNDIPPIAMIGKHDSKSRYHGWYHTREMLLCDHRGRRGGSTFFLQLRAELRREEVERNGTYVGTVVYVHRGHDYGWRPEKAHPNSKLTSKLDAIRRLR